MPAHDPSRRNAVTRPKGGRHRGVAVYLPADVLRAAGIEPELVTHFRVWGSPGGRGGLRLRLYREP